MNKISNSEFRKRLGGLGVLAAIGWIAWTLVPRKPSSQEASEMLISMRKSGVPTVTMSEQAQILREKLLAGLEAQGKQGDQIQITQAAPEPAVVAPIQLLKEVLASKNDNDPRMDTELKKLTAESREQFRAYYRTLPREKLNDRGTVIFLLGRNIESPEDVEFLTEVLNEPVCLGLKDCSKLDSESELESESHLDGVKNITLAYPQLMSLRALRGEISNQQVRKMARTAVRKSKWNESGY